MTIIQLQSSALPTELSREDYVMKATFKRYLIIHAVAGAILKLGGDGGTKNGFSRRDQNGVK